MAEFIIKLADERGRVQEQVQSAATAEELRARFTHAGYNVFSIRARGGFGGIKRGKVKLEPFLIFNQQFLTLVKAGLPILGSLQMLSKIQKNAQLSSSLDDVANRIKTGDSLSDAFEAQTGFPVMYTTTLLAGERSGNLQEVLERYVNFQKVSLTFRKKLTASLIYPALLLTLVCGLMVFLLAVVVPQFAILYDQMGSKLPAMTVDLMNFGKWLNHNFIWLLLGLLTFAFAAYRFSITERGRDLSIMSAWECPSSAKSGSSTRSPCFPARFPRCSPAACRWCRRLKPRRAPSLRAGFRERSSLPSARSARAKAWPNRSPRPTFFPACPRR